MITSRNLIRNGTYWLCKVFKKVPHVQDMARGSLSTVRQSMQRAKSDLSAKEYRNIDSKYRKQLLELKTAEMAASDLNEYHKVHSSWPASLSIEKCNNTDQLSTQAPAVRVISTYAS